MIKLYQTERGAHRKALRLSHATVMYRHGKYAAVPQSKVTEALADGWEIVEEVNHVCP